MKLLQYEHYYFQKLRLVVAIIKSVQRINYSTRCRARAFREACTVRTLYGNWSSGSGKTVLLLARAIHLVREHPEWKIKILTYNRSLKTKIENKLNSLAADLAFMNVRLENIDVSTFHKFALDTASICVPQKIQ
ncbi:UvrD-helicase domain-containing protein [Bacillus paranthracis]